MPRIFTREGWGPEPSSSNPIELQNFCVVQPADCLGKAGSRYANEGVAVEAFMINA